MNSLNIQRNISILFHSVVANRWLHLILETIGNLFLFCAVLCVLFKSSISSSVIGLVFTYAVQMTVNLNVLVRLAIEINKDGVSAERINEYIEQPKEASWDSVDAQPPPDWPENGAIKFENFKARYENNYRNALKGISFAVKPREKISIVGATGAGKTTLVNALFRIIEGRSGAIYIDGVDISRVGLGRLRTSLNIIPEDPILFSGSLRMNLDPGQKFTDNELWTVLHESHLGYLQKDLSDGLDHFIEEGGHNFSVGERQMICVARALLRKSAILILDEATSNIDWWSESLIEKSIQTHFNDCTILSVDHRLKHVLESDRVLVLSNGLVAEYDTPQKLLENDHGTFYRLAKEAGIVRSNPRPLKATPSREQVYKEAILQQTGEVIDDEDSDSNEIYLTDLSEDENIEDESSNLFKVDETVEDSQISESLATSSSTKIVPKDEK